MQRNGRQPGLLEQYSHLTDGRRTNGYGRRPSRPKVEPTVQGTIRRLMADRGFGFVQTEGVREDIFFHRSSVVESSFEELKEGDLVEFEMQHNPRAGRTCAVNLKPSTKPKSEVRQRPQMPPRPAPSRGRIFTGWREDLDRMERLAERQRMRAEGAGSPGAASRPRPESMPADGDE